MQVLKILYNIDYRRLNKINQEIEYIKDNKILNPIDNNKSLDLGGSYVEVKYDCAKKDYVYGDSNGEPHLEWNP